MTFLQLVQKNLLRKKLRAVLTMTAIFVAFVIFGVLATLQGALNAGAETAGADRLIVTNRINFTLPMPIAYVNRTRSVDGVKTVAHASWFGGYYQETRNFLVAIAVDPEPYLDIYPEYVVPPQQRQAFLSDRGSMLVGKAVADKFGFKPGDRVPIRSSIWRQRNGSDTWDFTVAGIISPSEQRIDTNFVIFHYEYFKETRSFGGDTVGWMIVKTDTPKVNERVMPTIDSQFANSAFETETKTEAAFNKAFAEQLGDIGFIVTAVVGAAFVTILLIVGNTMMLTVRERTGEIAVLKTIGFTAERIFGMVLAESMLLAYAGGLAGITVAWLVTTAIGESAGGFLGPLAFSMTTLVTSLILMTLLGVLTGALPAWRAMRIDVITALARK